MLSRSFWRKIRFFYLQLWPWRQFVYAAFASRDIARRARTPAVEGKGRDHARSAEERRRRTPLLRLMHFLTHAFNILKIRKILNFMNKNANCELSTLKSLNTISNLLYNFLIVNRWNFHGISCIEIIKKYASIKFAKFVLPFLVPCDDIRLYIIQYTRSLGDLLR